MVALCVLSQNIIKLSLCFISIHLFGIGFKYLKHTTIEAQSFFALAERRVGVAAGDDSFLAAERRGLDVGVDDFFPPLDAAEPLFFPTELSDEEGNQGIKRLVVC